MHRLPFWAALRDDRCLVGSDPPAALFRSGPGRGKAIQEAMLKSFCGLAPIDKCTAYNALTIPGALARAPFGRRSRPTRLSRSRSPTPVPRVSEGMAFCLRALEPFHARTGKC